MQNIQSKSNRVYYVSDRFSVYRRNSNATNVDMRLCKFIPNHLGTQLMHEWRICVSFQHDLVCSFHLEPMADNEFASNQPPLTSGIKGYTKLLLFEWKFIKILHCSEAKIPNEELYLTNQKEADYVQIYRQELRMFLGKLKHGSQHANNLYLSARWCALKYD